jgi:hypothetical protein
MRGAEVVDADIGDVHDVGIAVRLIKTQKQFGPRIRRAADEQKSRSSARGADLVGTRRICGSCIMQIFPNMRR